MSSTVLSRVTTDLHSRLIFRGRVQALAENQVIIKDHLAGELSHARQRLIDWVGNIGHGVPLRYAYWSQGEGKAAFAAAGLREIDRRERLKRFGPMLRWLFERRLHFISRLLPETS